MDAPAVDCDGRKILPRHGRAIAMGEGRRQPEMKSAAAAHAVAPHLQELERQNAELRNHLAREVRRNLDQRLAEAVPNFREIDRDPRWLQWLTGRDALSGQIRQQLLDDAVAKGNAGRVIAFFRGFLQEAAAGRHGQPGQAAGGKRIYTRAQITQMASLRRKGVYSDAEWAAWEAELIAAG